VRIIAEPELGGTAPKPKLEDINKMKVTKGERKIGHYTLGKSIGEGTFGKVKVGTH
jgi:hypothetical protein